MWPKATNVLEEFYYHWRRTLYFYVLLLTTKCACVCEYVCARASALKFGQYVKILGTSILAKPYIEVTWSILSHARNMSATLRKTGVIVVLLIQLVIQSCSGLGGMLYPRESETRSIQSFDGMWNFKIDLSSNRNASFEHKWYNAPLSQVHFTFSSSSFSPIYHWSKI